MPIFYAGYLNKNDILKISATPDRASNSYKNIINIISF